MKNMSFRDLIANMPNAFNTEASQNLVADIQFHATDEENGYYYLHIEDSKCTFHEGAAKSPKVTIHSPSNVWLAINRGEMNGALAFMQGKFRVEGDFGLLMRMSELFKRGSAKPISEGQ